MSEHHHEGPWVAIGFFIVILAVAIYADLIWNASQSDNFSDRLAALERGQDCPPPNTIVTTRDGEELCLTLTPEAQP